MTNLHYNCLGCPNCSNPLHDSLFVFERNKEIKTVACSNTHCDYIGARKGFKLLSLEKLKEIQKCQKETQITEKIM